MSEAVYVPPSCLDDARRVLAVQNPDTARQAEKRWPARVWRAAMKAASRETDREAHNDPSE